MVHDHVSQPNCSVELESVCIYRDGHIQTYHTVIITRRTIHRRIGCPPCARIVIIDIFAGICDDVAVFGLA